MTATRLYLHVGLPKTGTTFIQSSLWESRERLGSAGCLVPGPTRESMWRAASDFLGRRPRGADAPRVHGAWEGLITAVREWDGDRVIVSQELFGTASNRQAHRLVRELRPCEVHVVITVRDLSSTLPSAWQQEIRKGRTWRWGEFVAAVRDPETGPPTAGVAFWLRFDVERMVRLWSEAVSAERVHVVVVPSGGAPADVLLSRFAQATGADGLLLPATEPDANASVGVAQTEALRRLNVALGGALNEREYTRVIAGSVVPALRASSTSAHARLPAAHREWAEARSVGVAAFLREHPCDVVGDLTALSDTGDPAGGVDPDELGDADVLQPMQDALVAVSRAYAQHWSRTRRREATSNDLPLPARVASRGRAVGYRAKVAVLERADDNKVFGSIARAYLRRTSSGR